MKKILCLSLLALLFACTSAPKPVPVDIAAEEEAIKEVFDVLFSSIKDRNIDQLASVFTTDGVFMGTSPDEVFTKDSLVAAWTQMMQIPEITPFEFISEPLIRIQPDGKTAVVAQQYYWKLLSPIPLRQTFCLVKSDSVWLIDFFDFSFIPYNNQVPLLNKAVSAEKE